MRRILSILYLHLLIFLLTRGNNRVSDITAKPRNLEAASDPREEASASAGRLPVRRVVLYKNGVGYFEHLGTPGHAGCAHRFTSAQLNDVLKS